LKAPHWAVIGHDWAVALLRQRIESGQVAHAYLFSGPPQIGKTRLALSLAQALNCEKADPPCGTCPSCAKIAQNTHPDVQVIVGQGTGNSIKIEQVRALQRDAVLAPYEGRYRVLILRRADLASLEAANSLLKTLEEPPAHVVLILTAVDAQALPPTVISRCQRLDLRPAARQIVEESLHARDVAAAQARLLARLSGGRIGWAFDAAADGALLRQRQQDLDQLLALLPAGRVERLDFAAKANRDLDVLLRQIGTWTGWWRDLLLLCSGQEQDILNIDRIEEMGSLAGPGVLSEVWAVLQTLQEAAAQLEANVNTRLVMEGLLLRLPRWYPVSTGESVAGSTVSPAGNG
jgi:DNA polymerase-3 subunit delta'